MSAHKKQVERLRAGVNGFAVEMRDQGIHVGLGIGNSVVCVCCDELWPCQGSKEMSGERPPARLLEKDTPQ